MAKITKEEALRYHAEGKPGKIEVIPTKPHSTQTDLSLAYSPGVAEPCLEIEKNPLDAYEYTAKGNLVAVISNGTAVLGLGDIGPLAGKPVMEGKGLLFKIFAGIDVFDIEVNEKDPEKFIQTVKAISPTFGGINLEDIKAPECFEIETRLKNELDIPVMHDDQHGTAIISGAGLINALEIAGKKIEDVKIVVNGAGAASISCTKLYVMLGARKENIVMCDSKGVISTSRPDLNAAKREFATDRPIKTLQEAVVGADVFLGLSVANVLTKEMVRSMNADPIVFALANPNPEISYADAMASRDDIIFATGRSDYPNQINNVLGFPYIFRGALDTHAKAINEEMKRAAVYAIADLAKEPVPDVVNAAYKLKRTTFGRDYILPKALDPRLLTRVSCAVAKAAIDSGVSRKTITDWEGYANHLREMMGYDNKLLRSFTDMAKANPKRVVFAEANHVNMLKAAAEAKAEGICFPILLGNEERLAKIAAEENISLDGIEIVNLRHDRETERRHRYARILSDKKAREGVTYSEACEKMVDRNAFGMMMVATGDADAFVTGVYSRYSEVTKMAEQIIGIRPSYKHFGALNILTCKKGTFFMADTLINRHPSAEVLIDIARLTHDAVKFFAHEPVMAMLSYSNFGADKQGSPLKVHEAIDFLHKTYPDMVIDGEMQVNFALDKKLRDDMYPFNKLKGQDVNTLIFPNLSSANSAYKLLDTLGITETIGPIQMGLNKPIHFTDVESSTRDIVNLTTVAVVDAIVQEQIEKEG
ncbi:malic enzyme, NAD binding domain protein [Parabacteroides distasonis str. 3776 D15 iv]|uniref:Malic enzyme, NAD binding domain protein n=1 Tax=Parabacteroides distasonis str. 3776 D15 i TaxID=1339342 RepID=A0AB34LJ84_PARDI|nr:NADP-dependent malic enzyme [Parabacteroides distasonis]KDS40760.1 malic enzyme, NAD binding domain protein [Parabacteroides distasonis str. 3776 D15 i]KDS54005.1 malic enzyme, NAD binding domain protein [Parabacteroides distasonis str. 3776 Po2 i]KDS72065.1 malic enzyme, NAD binding domain protein [Parabacteroides distasonis str. 3776 D15 iv]UVR26366.1 NADP-dependent malic enzyme [Parabacteroides distasonis]